MNRLLEYPFDSKLLRRKKLLIRRELLESPNLMDKRIAILGGSTTSEIKDMLELFLLNNGIRPLFYESEYGQYWEDAVFQNDALDLFDPDVILIHTSNRNIMNYPDAKLSREEVNSLLKNQYEHFQLMWDDLKKKYKCPIIQNNMEFPFFRLLGNKDVSDYRGRTNFILRLNQLFYDYADSHESFYINDINWLSADYGLREWSEPFYWHMYKYALNLDAIPVFAFNVANIIKSLYGKNKKALAIDLDNTLWGGDGWR